MPQPLTRFNILISASIPRADAEKFETELRALAHNLAEGLNKRHPDAHAVLTWVQETKGNADA